MIASVPQSLHSSAIRACLGPLCTSFLQRFAVGSPCVTVLSPIGLPVDCWVSRRCGDGACA